MGEFTDIFYNTEKLMGCGFDEAIAGAIANAIREIYKE